MGKIIAFLNVALAEAEHLLHDVHNPKMLVLGLTEDALSLVRHLELPAPSPPPVGAPVATPDTRDAELAAQRAQIAALTAAVDAQIARLSAAAQAPFGAPPPVVTAPVVTPLDPSIPSIPLTTDLPLTLPVPK